jgi:putative membrane protein
LVEALFLDSFAALQAIALGAFAGAFLGALPGLHSNTLNPLILREGLMGGGAATALLIASLSVARLASEAIPSVLFFIPDPDSAVAVLPGHRLALEGKAARAIKAFALSTLLSAGAASLLLPAAAVLLPAAASIAGPLTPLALSATISLSVASERGWGKRALAAACIIASGALGTALGFAAELFPGTGSASQMALLASFAIPLSAEAFLSLTASVSASHLVFSFASAASTGKARTGAAAAAESALGGIQPSGLPLFAAACMLATAVSCALVYAAARKWPSEISRADMRVISLAVLAIAPALALHLEGWQGVLALAVSALVGALPLLAGVKRIHLMGFILVPSLLRFLPLPGAT